MPEVSDMNSPASTTTAKANHKSPQHTQPQMAYPDNDSTATSNLALTARTDRNLPRPIIPEHAATRPPCKTGPEPTAPWHTSPLHDRQP